MRVCLLVVLVVTLTACASATPEPDIPPLHPRIDDLPEAVVHLSGPGDRSARVDVKVAATPDAAARGLMHVPELPDGIGMLFTYERERTGAFWMKDTLVTLDIAFFGADDTLRVILRMEPCEEDPCPRYDPGVAYTNALEVRAGWFAEEGVEPGWSISVTEIRP